MAKVLVSFDDALLGRIDERAAALGLSRSAFLAQLARERVDVPQRRSRDVRRRMEQLRAIVAENVDAAPHEDTAAFIRRMRDER